MKVLVIDDHPILRMGVRQLIVQNWSEAEVIEAETLEEATRLLQGEPPNLIVLDLSLPDASGTEGPARVMQIAKGVPVLVLSSSAEAAFAARLLKMGVSGYVSKERAGSDLAIAIRRVVEGGRYVTPEMADRLVDLLSNNSPTALPHEALSAQEYRVMLLIAAGKGPSEIAETMSLSVKTVGTYRARILQKANWKNNTELTKYCVQHGLTDPN
jgi:two-component system, NarL family, invasion response regulator UvrY